MSKEKKRILLYNSNNRQSKKPLKDKSRNGYELFNYVSETGDSISHSPIENYNGKVYAYYSEEIVRKIVNEELDKRVGSSLNTL